MEDEPTHSRRRDVLRSGLATLTAVGSAGCFGTLPPLGGRVDFGPVDAPPADEPTYRRWIPNEAAVADVGGGTRTFPAWPTVVHPQAFQQSPNGPYFDRQIGGQLRPEVQYFGLGWDELETVIVYHKTDDPVYTLLAAVDRPTVTATLTGSGYERAGTYEGYALFERPDVGWVTAVGDDAIVWSGGRQATRTVETIIDAGRGAVERQHEHDEGFRLLSAAAGASPYTSVRRPRYTDTELSTAAVRSFRFDDESVYFVDNVLFPPDAQPSADQVRRGYRSVRRSRTALDVEVSVDGRVATVEMRQSHRGFRADQPTIESRTVAWPRVSWGIDHDRNAETVTVRHEGGDPVDASNLSLELLHVDFDRRLVTQFTDEYDIVDVEDSVTVDVSRATADDAELALLYGIDRIGTASMFNYELSDRG